MVISGISIGDADFIAAPELKGGYIVKRHGKQDVAAEPFKVAPHYPVGV
jgi:hypothetical protein